MGRPIFDPNPNQSQGQNRGDGPQESDYPDTYAGRRAYEDDLESFQTGGTSSGGGDDGDLFDQGLVDFMDIVGGGSSPREPKEYEDRRPAMITGEGRGSPAIINTQGGDFEYERWRPPYANWVGAEIKQDIPQYTINDPLRILNSMSSAELVALQQEFVNAGYIDDETTLTGDRSFMIPTFTQLVTSADFNRVDWEYQLDRDKETYAQWLEDNPEEPELSWRQANPFVAPVYLAPDYATLAKAAEETVRGELGREVTGAEMKLLTGFLGNASKEQWQANEYNTQLANWEATARAQETHTDQAAGTVQGYDAAARFEDMFDDRFEGELEHRERVDTVNRKEGNLFGSIDTISRMTS